MSAADGSSVQVAVRIRPLVSSELAESTSYHIVENSATQLQAGGDNIFNFDYVFGTDTDQQTIYEDCVLPLVGSAFEGFNSTILAYGQTGSGKTYTMGSSYDITVNPNGEGIIPRVVRSVFELIEQQDLIDGRRRTKICVQFLEIYGEDLIDLLDVSKSSRVAIHETAQGEVFISGATEVEVSSYEQMMRQLEKGTKQRTTASTKMNQSSSRSHAIFTMYMEQTLYSSSSTGMDGDGDSETAVEETPEIRKCKFSFVDLAGSERASRTGTEGKQFREGIDINKGLFALGNVISALGDETKRGQHVPYRSSKLTRMLQDSLGGNSKTLMICCVSPAESNFFESVNALRYANRARNIRNKPVVNRDPTNALIASLRAQLRILASEILSTRKKGSVLTDYFSDDDAIALVIEEFSRKYLGVDFAAATPAPVKAGPLTSSEQYTATKTAATSIQNALVKQKALLPDSAELLRLKSSNAELQLETDHNKSFIEQLRNQLSDAEQKSLRTESEREYFRLKLVEANWDGATEDFDGSVRTIEGYLKEIESLRSQLLLQSLNTKASADEFDSEEALLETTLASSVARVIQQTKDSLSEEQKKVRDILEAESGYKAAEYESGDTFGDSANEIADHESAERRQKILTTEVIELSQSIQLKEQLLQQLVRSQQQYAAMKAFYEDKLGALNKDLDAKESEREKLSAEIEGMSSKKNSATVNRAKEDALREELRRRDSELQDLRKSKKELTHLSSVQSRVTGQMSKLQEDIKEMKSQRVELTKTIQKEKKEHLVQLTAKVHEIERLKRELSKTANEVKKVAAVNERTESKLKKVLNDGIQLRKKNTELQKASLTSVKQSARNVMSAASKSLRNVFSEREMKTKSWLESKIHLLSSKELQLEGIQTQCHEQLVTATRRESLENEKDLLRKAISVSDAHSAEQKEVLSDIEQRIDVLSVEMSLRGGEISAMEGRLQRDKASIGKQETFDALRMSAANTLPGAHMLIKLLFDMTVESRKSILESKEALRVRALESVELRQRAEEAVARQKSMQRSHEMELSRIMQEHEEKLAGLFNYSNVGSLINNETIPEDVLERARVAMGASPNPRNSRALVARRKSIESLRNSVSASLQVLQDIHLHRPLESEAEEEQDGAKHLVNMKTLLKVSSEQVKTLRHQLNMEAYQTTVLKGQLDEAVLTRDQIMRELEDKSFKIKFLEDEARDLRNKAEEYKLQLPCPGENVQGPRLTEMDSADVDEYFDAEEEFKSLGEEMQPVGHTRGLGARASRELSSTAPVHERLADPSNYTGAVRELFRAKDKSLNPSAPPVQQPKSEKEAVVQEQLFTRLTNRARDAAEKLRELRSNPAAGTESSVTATRKYASLEDRSLFKPRPSTSAKTSSRPSPSKNNSIRSDETLPAKTADELFIETAEGVTIPFTTGHNDFVGDDGETHSPPGSPRTSPGKKLHSTKRIEL